MDGEQQTGLIGTAQAQVGANDGFEEASPPERLAEDLSQTDLQLPYGQPVRITGSSIGCGQRPGQPADPAVEEGLHVSRAERIADLLEPPRVRAPAEAVVQAFESDPFTAKLLLGPLVAIQVHA